MTKYSTTTISIFSKGCLPPPIASGKNSFFKVFDSRCDCNCTYDTIFSKMSKPRSRWLATSPGVLVCILPTRSPFQRAAVTKFRAILRDSPIRNKYARGLRGGQTIKNETIYIQRTSAEQKNDARVHERGLRLGKRAFIVRHLFELRAQCLLARVARLRDRDTRGGTGSLLRDKMEMEFLFIVFIGARSSRFNLVNDKSDLRAEQLGSCPAK